ncbi:MAG: tetratricopeptide repeat protein [Caldilineaceae bacterium]
MSTPASFGNLLRTLRKRVGMTQGDLAAAVGYSIAAISALEQGRRLPDVEFVMQRLVPALAVTDTPQLARQLVEQAAAARGERPPTISSIQRAAQAPQEETIVLTGRLPPLPTPLIGRTAQVNQICDRLLGHGGRLLTLVGPPGIGKTTLALAVAAQLHHYYSDGALFVALAAVSDTTRMVLTIATAVGCSDGGPKPPQTKLIEFLRRKNMLLVLDNLEQLRDAAPLVAELVAECPGITILATSRERLHLRIEQRFKVLPLDLAAAVELFVQRAHAVDTDFHLSAHNQSAVEAICQRLDCLPLALELCAAQVDMFAPTQLLAHLQARRLDLLVDGAQDLPLHQRTLRTAIQRSYDLLDEAERALFRSLGVFVGGFDLDAAAVVVGWVVEMEGGRQETGDGILKTEDWRLKSENGRPNGSLQSLLSTLHALIGKSLVRVETTPEGEQRFLLLETIREFVVDQARAHGEEAQLRQRHYAAYLHLFRTGDSHLRGPEAVAWFARLALEQDNLRAAMQWALDEQRYADAVWLQIACRWFWHHLGHWYESGQWLAQLLPHRTTLPLNLQLYTVTQVVAMGRAMPEFQPLERWKDELLHLLTLCPDQHLQSAAWHFIAAYSADFAQRAAAWERAVACARAARNTPTLGPEFCLLADCDFILGSTLWAYATALIEQGQFPQALPLLMESREIFQRRVSQYEVADSSGTLGHLALLQGDLAQAHAYLHEAIVTATEFNYQEMIGLWQPVLGLVTLYRGDPAEARRLLIASLHLATELKDKTFLMRTCADLAETALCEGLLNEASEWLKQSLAHQANPRRNDAYEVARLWVAARLAVAQQQYLRSATLFGLAEAIHRQIHYAIGGPMRALADAALATVQAALEPAAFAEAFAAGQGMSLEQAFSVIRESIG